MKQMIRYKLKPDRVTENERLIAAVYAELAQVEPTGLSYGTFRLDDGVSFVHMVSRGDEQNSEALTALPSFKAFVAGIRERCEEPPAPSQLTEIGSYRFFAG